MQNLHCSCQDKNMSTQPVSTLWLLLWHLAAVLITGIESWLRLYSSAVAVPPDRPAAASLGLYLSCGGSRRSQGVSGRETVDRLNVWMAAAWWQMQTCQKQMNSSLQPALSSPETQLCTEGVVVSKGESQLATPSAPPAMQTHQLTCVNTNYDVGHLCWLRFRLWSRHAIHKSALLHHQTLDLMDDIKVSDASS